MAEIVAWIKPRHEPAEPLAFLAPNLAKEGNEPVPS
jgi:hypothetical protein